MAERDPLSTYNAKRDFTKTAEPKGTLAPGHGNRFMVQKHDATRLHWDLRLEVDGVMKSWAVTRGPSLNPDDKRLAVQTEDHPLSYSDFEGTIPAGEYGGGTVMLWDDGTWAPIPGKSAKDLKDGHLHFILNGERMKGEWLLIRLKPRGKERHTNWLLRKIEDEFAGGSDDLVEGAVTSVKTGRTMQAIAAETTAKELASWKKLRNAAAKPSSFPRKRGPSSSAIQNHDGNSESKPQKLGPRFRGDDGKKAQKLPAFREPQLCTLVDSVPTGSGWIHEVKYDGYRALIAVGGGKAKVFTRSGLDWSDKFPGIAEAAANLPVGSALIDGEIVAFKDGKPDFSTLKDAISNNGEMTLFAFDLLELDGEKLDKLPNVQRKERLRPLFDGADNRLQFAEHIVGEGEKLFQTMCREGYEGIVSKRADAAYAGKRTQNWLKIKCLHRQEFVIVGWTESDKSRGFRALLLGVNEDGKLRYAGKVGTGFTQDLMNDLRGQFDKLERKTPTVEAPRAATRGAHWVGPKLIAEIAFAEVTPDGVLRHSSFLGLRGDKKADEVVEEKPKTTPKRTSSVTITNPDRLIFPDSDVTKGDLAAFYDAMAPVALQWIANRPISLVRCPQGRGKHCFFQKHDAGSFGDHVKHVPIREKDGSVEPYLYVDDADGMLTCVQMGTIEFHGWGSSVGDVEKPDRLVFDLDPDEGLGFDAVKKAAVDLKGHLAEIGLVSFALLSGGKGVHVVVPLTPEAEWPAVKDFADRFSRALAQAEPDRFVATMSKAKRKGKIFLDWLRNQRGSTAVMPYTARARSGAPVAVPVTWAELEDLDTAAKWHVGDQDELLERASGKSLAGWGVARQTLPDL
ncbi:DNA ligase D [Sphingomonas bacterium]|uniref:DNA ligase D n=1 Tax=Sphingomonas bacterium TaxID=1895847 RepID=UPI0026154A39|nr:DNA ligase D [Sphingomonas bacterium]MDB5677637.1 ATP-dependent ligase [Sphingomonas bacterium]